MRLDPESASRFRERGWWRDHTLVRDFRESAAGRQDKVAIVSDHAERPREVLSFRQLTRLVDRFAGGLLELGVSPGDVVSIQLPNWWQFTALTLAIMRIGAVTNPIIPILRRREVGFILERSESRVAIVPTTFRGFAHGEMLADLAPTIPTLRHAFAIGPDTPAGLEDFDGHFLARRWEDHHPAAELDRLEPPADALAQIQFTSGTTGEPKGVEHTHNTLRAAMRSLPETLHLTGDDVVLMASTMAHQTGFLYGLLMPMAMGMKVVYQEAWVPDRMLELVEEEGVTFTMGATPFVIDAIDSQRHRPRDLRTLLQFTSAGAPIPPAIVEAAAQVMGTQVVAAWGMTENGAVTYTTPADPPDFASRSDGRPAAGMELRVLDSNDKDLPPGEVGRLVVRGAGQFVGYFKRPDLFDAAHSAGGWFDTGDLARMDETGAIRISGRSKDLILRGGENVPVVEVESAIYRLASVREVAVIAIPDERLGERACAVVVPYGEPPTLDDIKAELERVGMTKQFWPERLEIVTEMPKTPSGKIQKFRLRETLTGG